MDIKILDSHLREYLDTNATPTEIAKYVTLSGPTFDRTHKQSRDILYEIEVTTNRIDAASVYGIAREAAAILPQHKLKSTLKNLDPIDFKLKVKNPLPLTLKNNPKLANRLTGIVLGDIKNWYSPSWMIERLEAAGLRSLNAVVDITNYVMITLGHPCHAFDYDKIKDGTLIVRESKKGETITSFDGKTYTLQGGDIVFVNVDDEIIDLPGIIGTKNSIVSSKTKHVLLFFDNLDPVRIRKTSMNLGIRTMAATFNEKNVDPEFFPYALNLGVDLFKNICKAELKSPIYDVYSNKVTPKQIKTTRSFIKQILGVDIDNQKINEILSALGFKTTIKGDEILVTVPTFRAHDIEAKEDIVEEIARVYGYQNLPSKLMSGDFPEPMFDDKFKFEEKIRQSLKSLGGAEILTYSLVSKDMAGDNSLKLTNPLGSDTECLRTRLLPSLINATKNNVSVEAPFHLFEIGNIFKPVKNDLPNETMMVGGIMKNYDYRHAKGVLEAFFESLNISMAPELKILDNAFYYEYEVSLLKSNVKPKKYVPIQKYPPQIEDITISIPEGTKTGSIIQSIKLASKLVSKVELVDIYERNFTFRVYYQDPDKTLSDNEVEVIRKKIEKQIKYPNPSC